MRAEIVIVVILIIASLSFIVLRMVRSCGKSGKGSYSCGCRPNLDAVKPKKK